MCVGVFVYSKQISISIQLIKWKEYSSKIVGMGSSAQFPRHRLSLVGIYHDCRGLWERRGSQSEFPFFLSDWIRKSTFSEFFVTFDASFAIILTVFEIHFCFDNNISLMALSRSEFSPDLHLTQLVVLDRILDTFLLSKRIKSLIKANISTAALSTLSLLSCVWLDSGIWLLEWLRKEFKGTPSK